MVANSTKKKNIIRQLFKKHHNQTKNLTSSNEAYLNPNELVNYYTNFADNHPDLIIALSPDGEIVSHNRHAINRFLGYPADENVSLREYVEDKWRKRLTTAFTNALKGKTSREYVSVINNNQDEMFINVIFIPIRQIQTVVDGVYIIIQDETDRNRMEQELEISEKHLLHAQQIAKIGSWEYEITRDQLYCSDTFFDLFGMDPMRNTPSMEIPFELVHPDDYERADKIVKRAIQKGVGYVHEFRIYHGRTGELRYLRVQAEVTWRDNRPYKLVGVIKDYTEQKELELHMDENQKHFRGLFDSLSVGVWLIDVSADRVNYVSTGFETILNYPLEQLYEPDIWRKIIHPDDQKNVLQRQGDLAAGKTLMYRYRIITGDGTTKWVFDQTVPRFDQAGNLVEMFGMLIDITTEMEMQEQLGYFSTHDILTGLPNQRSLYEKLDLFCTEKQHAPFALLYLDLDRFKIINDSLGYQIGDKVLRMTTKRMQSILPENTYLTRISSNDFVILVTDYPNKETIFKLSEEIIHAIEKTLTIDGYDLHVTTSIGISFYPEDGDNKLTLIENAHAALYHAKQMGKNNFQLYSFSRDITSYKKYILEIDMRRAIENEEFEVYYQPRVNPINGVIQGAEALVRWNHEEWGLVSPGEFIPLAEENHLIIQIGDWVIKNVCESLRKWKDMGLNLRPISINMSPIRFLRKGLVEYVKEQLDINQISAKYLEFEITESSLLKNEKMVVNTLAGLRDLGASIAIDDFGTGYASLSYLREFHANTIKIDQLFIRNIEDENTKDATIISSILHLAKGLEMKVVAEGVEEYAQLDFLKQKECDEIQGYLYSKPVPIDKFVQMLQTGYLKPLKTKVIHKPVDERRNYYRMELPAHVIGEMSILEINKRKVNLGSAQVLIEDIGLGGLKVLSTLKLPVNAAIDFTFKVTLMGEKFNLNANLVWKNEAKGDAFYYGIKFEINEHDETRLAKVINKMSVLVKLNQEIPDTPFIKGNPYTYLFRNHM